MASARIRQVGRYSSIVALIAALSVFLAVRERHRWRQTLSPLWVLTARNIPYGPRPENRLDILRRRWSTGQADRPAVVIFHGGGWKGGSREDMLVPFCHWYLEHGFVVANVEYRLGSIPAAVEDAATALKWFVHHAPEYGAGRTRIVVTGASAGAHLALMAAFRSEERTAAVVSFHGVSDLTGMVDRPAIRELLPGGNPEQIARELSPVTYIRPGLPPVLSLHGTDDEIVPIAQPAHLTRALREAGGEAYEFYVEGAGHGFSRDQQQVAYDAVFAFLKSHRILDP